MRALFTLLILCTTAIAQGQAPSLWLGEAPARELGLNITGTLAGFFNSGGQLLPADPYLFSLKFSQGQRALRLGIGGRLQRRTEFLSFGDRTTAEQELHFRAGYEWRRELGERFTLFWALDAAARYLDESVRFSSFPNDILVSSSELGLGGGPALGIMFHLNSRVSFSTESFLYAYYISGRKEDPSANPANPTITRLRGLQIAPVMPSSLYAILKF